MGNIMSIKKIYVFLHQQEDIMEKCYNLYTEMLIWLKNTFHNFKNGFVRNKAHP